MAKSHRASGGPNRFERYAKIFGAVMLIGSFLIADVVAAHVYRWAARAFELDPEIKYRKSSEIYSHRLKENMSVDNSRWGPETYPVRTNSLGFKDAAVREVPLESEQYRIIFIGDSFTEGVGMVHEKTFVGLIGEALSEKNIEVFNAGVSSYSPIIYWRKIKHVIEDIGLKFDELVVYPDVSDVQDQMFYRLTDDLRIEHATATEEIQEKSAIPLRWNEAVKELIRKNTIVTYTTLKYIDDWLFPTSPTGRYAPHFGGVRSTWTVNEEAYEQFGRAGLESMALYMDKLWRLLKEHDIELKVAVYPQPAQVMLDTLDSIQVTFWQQWCEERGVPLINHFPDFLTGSTHEEKGQVLDKYFFQGDVHWNESGHRLIADGFLSQYRRGAQKPAH